MGARLLEWAGRKLASDMPTLDPSSVECHLQVMKNS